MCTIMNRPNPQQTADDSGFHIVQKNGQFEIVKLEPIGKKTKTKLNSSGCDNKKRIYFHAEQHCKSTECHLGPKHQIFLKDDSSRTQNTAKGGSPKCGFNKATDFEDIAHTAVRLKTYSRVGKKDIKLTPIHLKKIESPATETAALFAPLKIKTEPELDIVDEEPDQIEKNKKRDSLVERLVPTGEQAILGNTSIKIIQKVTNPTSITTDEGTDSALLNARSDALHCSTLAAIPGLQLLQDLSKKATKCNVCGMIFPQYQNQVITLGRHFLRHKTSVINVVKEYNSDTHSKQNRTPATSGPSKSPVILNNLLKKAPKPMAIIPLPVLKRQPIGKKKLEMESSRIETSKLPTILRKRKLINIKPIPHDLLQRLRSCHTDQVGGQSHVIIGNTLIKPIKPASTLNAPDAEERATVSKFIPESKRSDDMALSDTDDDIEIVEQKPELIVIDDNDELEELKDQCETTAKKREVLETVK